MTTATLPDRAVPIPAPASPFRVCSATGRRIHRQAELLIRANAVIAVVALLIGAVAALLLVLTRWQAIHLLPAQWYYRILGVHGMNMLIFFIIFFEMAVLWFCGTVLLNARPAAPRLGWANFGLMLSGLLIVEWAQWSGRADVLFTSYPPLRAHPFFYLGVILFAVGALVVVAQFFATLVIAKRERTYEGSVPLVVYGAITAAIIAVITLVHGAMIYIPTFLWSIGVIDSIDPQMYRMIWWALGHSSQQINVAAMVAVWYMLGGLTVGAVVLNEKVSRSAFVLYILFISMASAHHLLVDPGFGPAWKIVNTSYFMYMAVLASMIHGFTVPAGMELGMRLRGYTDGLFGWLRRAPWGDPGFSATARTGVLFPCTDAAVDTVSRRRAELAGRFVLPLSPHPVVELLMDKVSFARHAAAAGLPVPRTEVLTGRADALAAATSVAYPCVLKPAMKSATWLARTSAKGFTVHDADHLLEVYDSVASWSPELLVQEWVAGPEAGLLSCNAYFGEDGAPLATFVARKVRQWPPEVGTSASGEECRDDEVLDATLGVFGGVGFRGLAYLEMKRDVRTGRLMIIEPNVGRPTGRSAIAEAGGVELVYTAYCDAAGLPLPDARTQQYGGARWLDLRRDLQAAVVARRQGTLSMGEWIRSVRGPKAHAIWSSRDPAPFAVDLVHAARAGSRMLRSKPGRGHHHESGSALARSDSIPSALDQARP